MESGKLDIDSEVKTPKEPVATYKPISEDDSVLIAKQLSKEELKMAKLDGDTDIDDGAQELMLKNIGKINSNKDASEVKFVSENGDAKIDVETVKQTLTGMTKEELMKFANDPFWIRLRWFMFIVFWLAWAAMLAGAIAIIVGAPKCTAPEPKKLWEKSPIVRLDMSEIGGTLKGLEPILDTLKLGNVRVISMVSSMKKSKDGHTIDFRDIDPKFGKIDDFKGLVNAAGKREQEIILEIDPSHTSVEHPWFNKSVHGIEPWKNYYVWADAKVDESGNRAPPRNWLSVFNGSAWEWNDARQQYYLHQFNKTQPDLNYNNPAVVEEFSSILRHWLQLGITGFRLANSQYLLEDLAAGDESRSTIPAPQDSYRSIHHAHTRDVTNNTYILQIWRNVVSNHTKNIGLFSLQEDITSDMLEVLNDNHTIDLPQKSRFLSTAYQNITAVALRTGVNNSLSLVKETEIPTTGKQMKGPWPAWNLNSQETPLNQRMNEATAESLTLMTLMLPGTPILSYAQTRYPGEAFTAIAKARDEPAFLYGIIKTYINNGTIFVYTRVKSGNPGYLIAYQSGDTKATMDLSKYDKVSEEVTIIALSSNYDEEGIAVKNRISSNSVPISPKSTLVVQFAPKTE